MLRSYKIKLLFSIVLQLAIVSLKAQSLKQKAADKLYANLNYFDAYDYYKELAKEKNASYENIKRAGICAYNLMDYGNAEVFLKKNLNTYSSQFSDEEAITLFHVLKYNGKYDEVGTYLKTIENKGNYKKIVELYKSKPNYLTEIKNDSALYTVTNLKDVNTESSEFSPYIDKRNFMIYSSNRKNAYSENKVFGWDNTYFIDSYTAKMKDSIHFEESNYLSGDFKTKLHDGPVAVNGNRKKLFVTRTNVGTKDNTIKRFEIIIYSFQADGKWDDGVKFPYNSADYSVGHPAVTNDGNRLYFSSDMPGGFGKSDIWYSDFKDNSWQKPVNLGAAINTSERETFPYIFDNEVLFFSSDGRPGLGGLDVYFCSPTMDLYFEPQALEYPINTKHDDFGFYLNTHLKSGYFSSNRPNGKGKDDIYYFNSKKTILPVIQNGTVYDQNIKVTVSNAKVFLMDKYLKILDSTVTDKDGKYSFNLPGVMYNYKTGARKRSRYYDKINDVDSFKNNHKAFDVYLYPRYRLLVNVIDSLTNNPVEDVSIRLVHKYKNKVDSSVTDEHGNIYELLRNRKMNDKVELGIVIEKEGYRKIVSPKSFILDTNTVVKYYYKLSKRKEVTYELEIVDELGNPINANVEIVSNSSGKNVFKDKVNGKERIRLKSGDEYGVSIAADGYLFQSDNLDVPDDAEYNTKKRIVMKRLSKGSNIVLKNVFFDVAMATLRPASITELDRLYDILVANPSMKIELSGHTDNQGYKIYNQKLSQARAKAVVDYLIKKGIFANRLVAKGYGFDKPVATNETEEGRQLNRRTELKILEIN